MKKILIIVLVLLLSGCTNYDKDALKEEIKQEILAEISYDYEDFNNHLKDIIIDMKACTISIITTLDDESTVLGSGVIYTKDGTEYTVLTNEHVIRYAVSIKVFSPQTNTYIEATVLDESADYDLASLTIYSLEDLSVCTILDTDYAVGEFVLAVGTSTDIAYANTVTLGIITRIDDATIQHDAAINSGSSGGPLFNMNGELIGINVSKLNTTYVGTTKIFVEGMGFSIPIEIILEYLDK